MTAAPDTQRFVGSRAPRREDPRLLTGRGRFVADLVLPGLVEAMPNLMRRQIEKAIGAHCSPKAAKVVKVRIATLIAHAGAVGAASLAIRPWGIATP